MRNNFCYWTKYKFCTDLKFKILEWNSNLDNLWIFRDISKFDKILENHSLEFLVAHYYIESCKFLHKVCSLESFELFK
jgi:hypothetical protein